MDKDTFDECYEFWLGNPGNVKGWEGLARKNGYLSGESLRSSFKRERKKLGISRKTEYINKEYHTYSLAKIAVIDVETLPTVGFVWGMYDQNLSMSQIIKEGCLLSWAGKELNSSDATGEILTPKEAKKRDTSRLTERLWNYMFDKEIIIGHNFREFDRRVINTAFLMNNKNQLKYKVVDTLETARREMSFLSNKMAFINQKLGIRNKISNEGFALWAKCADGDSEALKTMLEYNIGDVYANEELYYRLRGFMNQHPNLSLYNTIVEEQCPVCGGVDLKVEGLYPPTAKSRYESVRCTNCGSLSRLNKNLISPEKRKKILSK